MGPHVRVIAAVLIPLLALTPSCAAPRQEVRLQFQDREVVFTVPAGGGTPIAIPEPELWGSFRTAARAVVVHPDPLAAAEEAFDVAEASGSYRYYARSGRLVPENGLEIAEGSAERLTREYLEWCGGTRLGGGDCLHLLGHTAGLSLHGRYVVTLVMSMTASFGPMLDSLREFADPNAVAVMLASAVAMYLVLLLVPEPISKLISLTLTGTLIGYLGLTAFWDLVYGWRALARTVDAATDFSQLRGAAHDFGKVLGPQIGQLLILLVSHSLGKGIAAKGATIPPRYAEASAQTERLLRVRLAAAGAARSVTLGAGAITISLATSATVVGGSSSNAADNSPLGDDPAGRQDKLLSQGEIDLLKKNGIDIHEIKGAKGASMRDLYKTPDGNIVVKPKGGTGPGEPTGLNINDFTFHTEGGR